jgi:succinoglycan biosynthesis protein ExoM
MVCDKEHIAVCVCTFKRSESLGRLLASLARLRTDGLFTVSAVIVDNDPLRSAAPVVEHFIRDNTIDVSYAHFAERNLALLRNVSVGMSIGDYVAFIDDDECPTEEWLLLLHAAVRMYGASGAFGPVLPDYKVPPPDWVVRGGFCERPRLPTGTYLQWWHTRTGNALIKREIFLDSDNLFDSRFRLGGEDVTLFEKLIAKGHRFVWCDEAVVREDVPATRLTLAYFVERSTLTGHVTYRYYKDQRNRLQNTMVFLKSVMACSLLFFMQPLWYIRGYHHFAEAHARMHHHWAIVLTYLGRLSIEERNL